MPRVPEIATNFEVRNNLMHKLRQAMKILIFSNLICL